MRAIGVVVVAAVALAAVPGVASAGDGFGIPPAKVDGGYLTFRTADGTFSGAQWLVGLNWATIYPKKTRFDIGLGYVGAAFTDPVEPRRVEIDPKGVTVLPDDHPVIQMHGGYLELSTRVAAGKHWRTWLSTRGELLSVDGDGALGGAARLTAEVWGGVMSGRGRGIAVGVFALGVWVEASARELGDREMVIAAASAGMSVRVPLILVD
jgi:hypothetical protein